MKQKLNKEPHVPIRMCIFCKRRFPKRELLRLALTEEGVAVFDERQRMPGRGAYVCRSVECVEKLDTKKGVRRLASAFRGRLKRYDRELFETLLKEVTKLKE